MKWLILFLWGGAIFHLQLRGQVRLPWTRQLPHASSVLAPLNSLALLLSKVPTKPTVPATRLPDLNELTRKWKANWQTIRDECTALAAESAQAEQNEYIAEDVAKGAPTRIELLFAGKANMDALQTCPQLLLLLQQTPGLKSASILIMPPNSEIAPQRGPYAGLLCAQLDVAAPNDGLAYMEIDGIRHARQEGQCLVFDPSYVTSFTNKSDLVVTSLECDIERPLSAQWAQHFNRWLSNQIIKVTNVTSLANQPRPMQDINKARLWLERQWHGFESGYKGANPTLHKAIKISLLVLAVLIFLAI